MKQNLSFFGAYAHRALCPVSWVFHISIVHSDPHTAHSEVLSGTLSPHEGHMGLESQDAADPPNGAQGDLQNVTEK